MATEKNIFICSSKSTANIDDVYHLYLICCKSFSIFIREKKTAAAAAASRKCFIHIFAIQFRFYFILCFFFRALVSVSSTNLRIVLQQIGMWIWKGPTKKRSKKKTKKKSYWSTISDYSCAVEKLNENCWWSAKWTKYLRHFILRTHRNIHANHGDRERERPAAVATEVGSIILQRSTYHSILSWALYLSLKFSAFSRRERKRKKKKKIK